MALFARIFHNRKQSRDSPCKWGYSELNKPWPSAPLEPDQIRLVLYRDHELKRSVLFDSSCLQVHNQAEEQGQTSKFGMGACRNHPLHPSTPEGGTPQTVPPKYTFSRHSSDVKMLGEMMFGSGAMVFRGSTLKVHTMRSPPQLMVTKVFQATQPNRDNGDAESFDSLSMPSSSNECTTPQKISGTETSTSSMAHSVPVDVPSPPNQKTTLENEDSGISASVASSCSSFGASMPSPSSSGSITSGSNSLHSLQRRWLRSQNTSLEHNLRKRFSDEGLSEPLPSHKRAPKIGVGIIFGLQEGDDKEMALRFQNFFFSHITLVESHVNKLGMNIEKAYLNKKHFLPLVVDALAVFRSSICDLYTAPRLSEPVWLNMMCHSTHKVALCQQYLKELMMAIDKFDTKNTKFFLSTLLTAVLTHHLAWVPTVTPAGATPSRTYLDKHSAKWLDALAKSHPYNPLWAQLGDVYGAIGFPLRLSRTIVVGKKPDIVSKLLYILSYFMRCSEIHENEERLLEGGDSSLEDLDVTVEAAEMTPIIESGFKCMLNCDISDIEAWRTTRETCSLDSNKDIYSHGCVETNIYVENTVLEDQQICVSREHPKLVTKSSNDWKRKAVHEDQVLGVHPSLELDLDCKSSVKTLQSESVGPTVDHDCERSTADIKNAETTLEQVSLTLTLKEPSCGLMENVAQEIKVSNSEESNNTGTCELEINESPKKSDQGEDNESSPSLSESSQSTPTINELVAQGELSIMQSGDSTIIKTSFGGRFPMFYTKTDENGQPEQTNTSVAVISENDEIEERKCQISPTIVTEEGRHLRIRSVGKSAISPTKQNFQDSNLLEVAARLSGDPMRRKKSLDTYSDIAGDSGCFDGTSGEVSSQNSSPRSSRKDSVAVEKESSVENMFQDKSEKSQDYISTFKSMKKVFFERSNSMFNEYFEDNSPECDILLPVDEKLTTMPKSLCKRLASVEGSSSMFDEYMDESLPELADIKASGHALLRISGRSSGYSDFLDDGIGGEGDANSKHGSRCHHEELEYEPREWGDAHDAQSPQRPSSLSLVSHRLANPLALNLGRQTGSMPARCHTVTPTELGRRRHPSSLSTASSVDVDFFQNLKEVAMPCSEVGEGHYLDYSFGRSLLGGFSDHYLSDFALHGTSDTNYLSRLHHDLTMTVQNSVLDEPIAEACAVVADTDKWSVRLMKCQYATATQLKCEDIEPSPLVENIIKSVRDLWKMKMSPEFCLMHLEDRLQEVYFKSRLLAEYIFAHKSKYQPTQLAAMLGFDRADLPLLLAVAGTHTPLLSMGLS